jgi:transcriptional regulator with XRE-family HTH domain
MFGGIAMPRQTGPRRTRQSNLLGEYVRSLRERKELPIRKVAAKFDRTDSWLHHLETGKHGTDHKSLYDLVTFLDGDFFYALACLCRDEGVPEQVAKRIAVPTSHE